MNGHVHLDTDGREDYWKNDRGGDQHKDTSQRLSTSDQTQHNSRSTDMNVLDYIETRHHHRVRLDTDDHEDYWKNDQDEEQHNSTSHRV